MNLTFCFEEILTANLHSSWKEISLRTQYSVIFEAFFRWTGCKCLSLFCWGENSVGNFVIIHNFEISETLGREGGIQEWKLSGGLRSLCMFWAWRWTKDQLGFSTTLRLWHDETQNPPYTCSSCTPSSWQFSHHPYHSSCSKWTGMVGCTKVFIWCIQKKFRCIAQVTKVIRVYFHGLLIVFLSDNAHTCMQEFSCSDFEKFVSQHFLTLQRKFPPDLV
jgi:hypothetical protein